MPLKKKVLRGNQTPLVKKNEKSYLYQKKVKEEFLEKPNIGERIFFLQKSKE